MTGDAIDPQERGEAGLSPSRAATELYQLPPIWLRDNCHCAACRDRGTGERLFSITDLPAEVTISSVRRAGGRLEVVFGPDGHRSSFDREWLARFAVSGVPSRARRGQPAQTPPAGGGQGQGDDYRAENAKRLWSAAEIAPAFPQGSWPLFLADQVHREACLTAVLRDGFVVLADVPAKPDEVLAVAQHMGSARHTEYGSIIDVQIGATQLSGAFTRLAVPPCTAGPFRDQLLTVKLLCCIEDAGQGGASILVDGFKAAAELRATDPDAFAMLTSTPVTFGYADAVTDMRTSSPVIGLDPYGRIREIRFAGAFMQPLRLPPDRLISFYDAYRAFAELVRSPALTVGFRLRPGDCLVLDNTRVLNGRTAFAESSPRHMQATWADLDGLASQLAIMRHHKSNGKVRH
ncbi:MAG TPA: TauD/TfdA family dioxygenase [Streptosporangiaceae bacterium]